jgi:hypothetical protein
MFGTETEGSFGRRIAGATIDEIIAENHEARKAALSHLPSKGSFAGKSGSATSLISLTTTLADESV